MPCALCPTFYGVLIFFALHGWAAPPHSRFEVTTLPGWVDAAGNSKPLPSPIYTGYIDAGPPPSGKGQMYFHYFMVRAEVAPETSPVLVWYNGGPGASSLFGVFQEFGPLLLTEESLDQNYLTTGIPTLIENPHRWSKTHTLVAIDSPPPMGLSFCSEFGPTGGPTSCGAWTDRSVAHANHIAHKVLFTKIFPGLKGNPIFLAGESYGGMYVPAFLQEMMEDPIPGLNLRGMLVGDGFPGCAPLDGKAVDWCVNLTNVGFLRYPNVNPGPWYDIEFFHGHQQFSNELYVEIKAKCNESMLRATHGEMLSPTCAALVNRMAAEVGPFPAYNLYDNCPQDNPWTPVDSKTNPSTPVRIQNEAFTGDAHGIFQSLRARRAVARGLVGEGAKPNDEHKAMEGTLSAKGNGGKTEGTKHQTGRAKRKASVSQLQGWKEEGYSKESGTSSPCLANAMPLWFGQNDSLAAIGAPPGIRFINLDNGIGFNYTVDMPFVGPIYERAIREGFRILMYEGDTDACGLTTEPNEDAFFPLFNANLNKTRSWRPFANGKDEYQYLGGYITEWGKAEMSADGTKHVPQVLFVSVRGSGHMVPLNRPRVAAEVIEFFTHRDIFPDYMPSSALVV